MPVWEMNAGSSLPTIRDLLFNKTAVERNLSWGSFLYSLAFQKTDKMSKKVFFIKPRSTNLESKQKTGNKQHEVFPYKEREQSSANKLNVKL